MYNWALLAFAVMMGASLWLFLRRICMEACLVGYLPYGLPALLPVLLPYSYIYEPSGVISFLVIGIVVFQAGFIAYALRRQGKANDLPISALSMRIVFWGAMLACVFLLAEIIINPNLRSGIDFESRRESLALVTPLYKISVLCSGACLLLLGLSFRQKRVGWIGLYSAPWLFYALLTLYTGNRQFVFVGILVIAVAILVRFGRLNVRSFLTLALIAFVSASALFTIQYLRGWKTAGRQDAFFMQLFGITERDADSFIHKSYGTRTLATTAYAYYGTQYSYLSFIADNDLRVDLPLVYTVPFIYRRISGPMGWPDDMLIRVERNDENASLLGAFPRVWGTKFMSFYYEFGWYSVFLYPVLEIVLLFFLILIAGRQGGMRYNVMIFSVVYLAFGVNFMPLSEQPIVGWLSLLLLISFIEKVVRREMHAHVAGNTI